MQTPSDADGDHDAAIRATDDEAAICRLSAAKIGYVDDPWAAAFVRGRSAPPRRSPIINRGTHVRICAIDNMLETFLCASSKSRCQVLSLGAGSDTRFYRFKSRMENAMYFEVDFLETMLKKTVAIRKCPELLAMMSGLSYDAASGTTTAAGYAMVAGDLRQWVERLVPRLLAAGFDPSLPTLVISECALVYVNYDARQRIIGWLRQNVATLAFIECTVVEPNDAFGRMMVFNLKTRNICLPGAHDTPSVAQNLARLRDEHGFPYVAAVNMATYWANHVSPEEKQRIGALEMLDEVEEWALIGSHYCFASAGTDAAFVSATSKI